MEPGRPRRPFAGGPEAGSRMGVPRGPPEGPRGPYLGRHWSVSHAGRLVGTGPSSGTLCRGSRGGGSRLGVRGGSLGALRAAGRSAIFGGTLSSGAQALGMDQGPPPGSPARGIAPPCGRGAQLHPRWLSAVFSWGTLSSGTQALSMDMGPWPGAPARGIAPPCGRGAQLHPRWLSAVFSWGTLSSGTQALSMDMGPWPGAPAPGRAPPCGHWGPLQGPPPPAGRGGDLHAWLAPAT